MNAVISGRAAVAMVMDGEQLFSIHYDAPDERVERAVEEWNMLLGGVNDLEYVDTCDADKALDRLEDAVDRTEALDLVLYLFDASLSDEIRRSASLELEELLEYPEIAAYLESILYARPLDAAGDPGGALRSCDCEAAKTKQLIESLVANQPTIRLIRNAFDATCEEFSDEETRREIELACLQEGGFSRLATAVSETTGVNAAFVSVLGELDLVLAQRLDAKIVQMLLDRWSNAFTDLLPHLRRLEKGIAKFIVKKSPADSNALRAPKRAIQKNWIINKSEEIRAYIARCPNAAPKEIVAALAKRGIKVTPAFVSYVKSKAPARRGRRRDTLSDTTSMKALQDTKEFVDQMGGIEEAQKALDVLKRLK